MIEPILVKHKNFVLKDWGWEDWICNDPVHNLCVKILFLKASHGTSLHYHRTKFEVLTVSQGTLLVRFPPDRGDSERIFEQGESFRVSPGVFHQLIGKRDTYLWEASNYHKEEDVVREKIGGFIELSTF